MTATIGNVTDLTAKELEDIMLFPNFLIRNLTVQDLHNLYFLLKLPATGEPTAVITLNYITSQAIKHNKQIY